MPARRCRKCASFMAKAPADVAARYAWRIVTLKGKSAQHAVRWSREVRRSGSCLTVWWMEAGCGIGFEEEVDSSD